MAVYTKLLAHGIAAGTDFVEVYTAPADKTIVIRHMALTCFSGSGQVGVICYPVAGPEHVWLQLDDQIGSVTRHISCRIVIPPLSVLKVRTTTPSMDYSITGYELG